MSDQKAGSAASAALETVKARLDAILAPGSEREQAEKRERVRSRFFATVRRALRHVPFMEDVVASYHCAMDPRTPAATRGVLIAALAYFVLPVDIVPDFIVGLGFTDDMAVLLAAFRAVQSNIKPEHYEMARDSLGRTGGTAAD